MKKYFFFLASLFLIIEGNSQTITLNIKTDSLLHHISPFIYGVNGAYPSSMVKSIREGGNRWSGYNWENGLSNAGADLGNQSDNYLESKIPTEYQNIPGGVTLYDQKLAKDNNQFLLTTVQAAGYVAAISGTATTSPSNYWNKVIAQKGSAFLLNPDLNDGQVFIDEYINYLKTKLGDAKHGGINAYSIDNEPEIWHLTHPKLHPQSTKLIELFSKTYATATSIKSIDSTALVFGPAFANWYGLNTFNGNDMSGWNVYATIKYKWFLSMYLDSMKILSNKYGKRLIDVIDLHWYPEAKGNDNIKIVNTSGGTEPISKTAIKARLQAPRSLWDSTYIENSTLLGSSSPVMLIKRIKESINKWYPETKIAISEYRFGAENHYSGGLALADALGVLGKENIYCANKWYASGESIFQSYSEAAFKLYTNYDNKDGMFGDIAIPITNNSIDTISAYASKTEEGKVHIIAINKYPVDAQIVFHLNGGYYKNAAVYGFDSLNAQITNRDSIKTMTDFNTCTYSIPAYSALHFIFNPVELPKIIKAFTEESDNKKINVLFSKAVIINNLTPINIQLKTAKGSILINNITISDTLLTLSLSDAISLNDTSLYLNVVSDYLISKENNIPLKQFDSIKVINKLSGSIPQLLKSELLGTGKTIQLIFSKNVTAFDNGFKIFQNKKQITILNKQINNDTILLNLQDRLSIVDTISGLFNNDTITFNDNTIIDTLEYFPIINHGPSSPLILVSSSINNSGFQISLSLNNSLSQSATLQDFIIKINGVTCNYIASFNGSTISFDLEKKIEYSDIVTITYTDNGNITSSKNAYLISFENTLLNTVQQEPKPVEIPALIEGENTYYRIGTGNILNNSSTSNGKYISVMPSDKIAYRIVVKKDSFYTLNFKYACLDNVSFKITYNKDSVDTVTVINSTDFNTFLLTGMVKYMKAGNYTIEITPIKYQVNFDFIEFKEGTVLPNTVVTAANVASSGINISVSFNDFVKEIPQPSDFVLTANDKEINIVSISKNINTYNLLLLDTIYKSQTVILKLTNPTIETENGSFINPFNRTLKNFSKIILTDINIIDKGYYVYYKNNKIYHNLPSSTNIEIFDIFGRKVNFSTSETDGISVKDLPRSCYFIIASYQGNIIYQTKLILSK